MGLQAAFFSSRSALAASAAQTATVSKNIANVNDATYSRRSVALETFYDSGVRIAGVQRAVDTALTEASLAATSTSAAENAVSEALSLAQGLVGDPQSEKSPAARIGALQQALIGAAAAPENALAAQGAIQAAQDVARTLREAAGQAVTMRATADEKMASAVERINGLLSDFDGVNNEIVRGTQTRADISDALDKRTAILNELAGLVGISTNVDASGAMSIYANGGATLYQNGARAVSMQRTTDLGAGAAGAAVFIDGAAVTGTKAIMRISDGALAGLARVRDTIGPQVQSELDEMARGLISAFAESDQSAAPTAPPRTGLFTWSDAPALAASGASGLAAQLDVEPAFDSAQGGNWTLLRDGGAGGAAYVSNTSGASGFSGRLSGLIDSLSAAQNFTTAGSGPINASVTDFATQMAGRFESLRQSATQSGQGAATLASQAQAALSAATGVNLDDQMTQMLDFERSFQTAAKMMSTIDQMYAALFDAVR